MMKNILFLLFVVALGKSYGQVAIGANTPDASALLDVNTNGLSSKKGFLPPRVGLKSNTDILTIKNPVAGMTAYNLADASTGASLIKGNRLAVWTSSRWDVISNLTELRSLKQPIDYAISSKTAQIFNSGETVRINNGEVIPLTWQASEVVVDDPDDVSLANNIFTIKTAAPYTISGSVIVAVNIGANDNSQVVLTLQSSKDLGLNWVDFFANSVAIDRLVAGKAQTIAIPQILHQFAANELVRVVLSKPSGKTNFGASAGVAPNNPGDVTKSLRFRRIRQ
ncbi:hypothetical protein [Soonwooa sp.]|uniref:hypothetical protein n=1 Tax=Soonwooa sp. TaxID=1938592 RepID=UPI0026159F3F|nr:hypothetical protein [Soonwooa sp.]